MLNEVEIAPIKVWVAQLLQGSYDNQWTELVGVFRTCEAGQRYGRTLIENNIIECHRKVAKAGSTKFFSGGWFVGIAARIQESIARWEKILAEPWVVGENGIFSIDNDPDEWTFKLYPFEIED